MRWQIGIDDCFKRRALPAKPLERSASATSSTGSIPRQVINDDDDEDVGASAPDPSQVTTFVLEVEHLVKLGCDRGKATAALVKYNDVEKALDACLDQVKTFVLLLDEHCLVVRQTFPNRVAADFVCLQATSVEAEATNTAEEEEVDEWGLTQEEKPEKKKEEASDGEEAGSAADDADEAGSTVDGADEEEDEDDDDDEEDEEEEEEEEDEEEDEEDGEAADADDREAADGEEDPSVLTQASEKGATTNPSPPPPKRITRRDAKDAASEVPLSHYHTASQPTLAAHGALWAQNCRSASALQKARNQAKTGQAEKKSKSKKPARKRAPARPQPKGGAESTTRIPRKRQA